MPTVQGEVADQYSVDRHRADHDPRVDQEAGDHRDAGQRQGYAGGEDAARGAVGALHVRAADAQGDVRGHHQHVGDGRAEHRDQDQQVALAGQRQAEADHPRHHQGQYRRLLAVGQREAARQVAGAGEGEDLPRVGIDDREEAGDQPGQADQVDELAHPGRTLVGRLQRFHQGIARAHQLLGSGSPGTDDQNQCGEGEKHQHGADQSARQVALGVLGFLGGQRHAFDGEEEPDRVGDRRPDPDIAERQEAAGAGRRGLRDVEQVGRVEVRNHRDNEHAKGDGRHRGDDEHQLQRLAGAEDVDADEHDVEHQVDQPAADAEQRLAVGADEAGDGRRGDGVFDEDRGAGEEAAPGPEGAAGEAVAAAGGRDHRRQLGEREAHAQVHGGHQQGGEEHPAPAALGQAEVPAGVVAGDHVGDAEPDQQDPAGGAFLQLTVLEVVSVDAFEVDPGSCGRMAGLFEGHGFFTSILLLSTPVFPVVCCTW